MGMCRVIKVNIALHVSLDDMRQTREEKKAIECQYVNPYPCICDLRDLPTCKVENNYYEA